MNKIALQQTATASVSSRDGSSVLHSFLATGKFGWSETIKNSGRTITVHYQVRNPDAWKPGCYCFEVRGGTYVEDIITIPVVIITHLR